MDVFDLYTANERRPSESPSQTYAREHTTSSEEDCWKRQVVLSLGKNSELNLEIGDRI